MKHRFLIVPLLLLSGCYAQSQVQYDYDVEKADCQDIAADAVDDMKLQKGRASALKAQFGECMRKQGWKLTTAKPPVTEPPIDAARRAGAVNQAPPAEPQVQRGAQQSTTETQPQGTVIREEPVRANIPEGASTYQPATGVEPAAGSAQPGRYFGPR